MDTVLVNPDDISRLVKIIGPAAIRALLDGEAAVVPLEASDKNGMKSELSGEFCEVLTVYVEEYDCEEVQPIPITWTNIKAIIKMFVDKSRIDKPLDRS